MKLYDTGNIDLTFEHRCIPYDREQKWTHKNRYCITTVADLQIFWNWNKKTQYESNYKSCAALSLKHIISKIGLVH